MFTQRFSMVQLLHASTSWGCYGIPLFSMIFSLSSYKNMQLQLRAYQLGICIFSMQILCRLWTGGGMG